MARRLAHAPNKGVPLMKSKSQLELSHYIQSMSSESDEESSYSLLLLNSPPLIGRSQPVSVGEAFSLASVASPESLYELALPHTTIEKGLSTLQLNTVKLSCLQNERLLPNGSRAGFLIGDGPGVGKGRMLSGIIYENHLRGRKRAIWVSESFDLLQDAERDLRDVGAGDIHVHPLNKLGYEELKVDGIIFSTYLCLIGKSGSGENQKHRLDQILQWCGEDFDGVIVFDECHRAKNLVPSSSTKSTKTSLAVLELQNKLPNARIVYSSGTAASESRNMAYMVRLGLWGQGTPFKGFAEFIEEGAKYGVMANELLAMEMKHRGMYIARQLAFSDVNVKIEVNPLPPSFIEMHQEAADVWRQLIQSFTDASKLLKCDAELTRRMWSQVWSAHQRFFKYFCVASKVQRAVEIAKHALESEKCVVISLQSTGESQTLETIKEQGQISGFVSTAKRVLVTLVQNHFPSPYVPHSAIEVVDLTSEDEVLLPGIPIPPPPSVLETKEDMFNRPPPKEALDMASAIKDRLLAQIEQLGSSLPPNTLDQLIDELGGPEKVADMTGRKGRIIRDDNGEVKYESRSEAGVSALNIREKNRFMEGEKHVAIMSAASSSGISLQADRRVKNQRQRVHITLELPWSADTAIQQFGRTHRSNQVSAPEYIFLISDLAGERRFVSIVAKRLESLGALTHGDRRATESRDLSQFNIDTEYGRAALDATMKAVINIGSPVPVVPPPADYKGEFFKDVAAALVDVGLICKSETNPGVLNLDKDYANISKFLNRILGMPVDLQNRLFQYFTDTLATIVIQAKESGRFDMGILDLGSGQDDVRRTELYSFTTRHPTGTAKIELHTFEVERGMSWEVASGKCSILSGPHEGFYVLKESRFIKKIPVLVQVDKAARRGLDNELYTISHPNKGLQRRQKSLAEIENKYRKVDEKEAEPLWNDLFSCSEKLCWHRFMDGKCRKTHCQTGLRKRTYRIFAGSVFSYISKIEPILSSNFGGKMQVVRLQSGSIRVVGVVVPSSCMPEVIQLLTEESENVSKEVF